VKVETSIGEVVDKLSILQLKKENIKNPLKLYNISREYDYLYRVVFTEINIELSDYLELLSINRELWDIEDRIRVKETDEIFDNEFIHLARLVYKTNDLRAEIKRKINVKYGSKFVEEKSYNDLLVRR